MDRGLLLISTTFSAVFWFFCRGWRKINTFHFKLSEKWWAIMADISWLHRQQHLQKSCWAKSEKQQQSWFRTRHKLKQTFRRQQGSLNMVDDLFAAKSWESVEQPVWSVSECQSISTSGGFWRNSDIRTRTLECEALWYTESDVHQF